MFFRGCVDVFEQEFERFWRDESFLHFLAVDLVQVNLQFVVEFVAEVREAAAVIAGLVLDDALPDQQASVDFSADDHLFFLSASLHGNGDA